MSLLKLISVRLLRNVAVSEIPNLVAVRALSVTPVLGKKGRVRSKHITPVVFKRTQSKKPVVEFYNEMSLQEAAEALGESADDVAETIVDLNADGFDIVEKRKALDRRLLIDLASAYGSKPRWVHRPSEKKMMEELAKEEEDAYPQPPAPDSELVARAPVVTIMGHVDHGKTTLLDALRNSTITAQEFGGITQHIGAFSVQLPHSPARVTIIDTPGHAAFKAMRSRGAHSTDIVVLVVAADDGAKDQTVESIKYIRQAGVPFVVAINKIDKPNADVDMTKRSLMMHDVVIEEMGGDVPCIEISALQGINLDKLQELLVAQAEIMELKSTPKGLVEGVVIESSTMQGLGKLCTMIVNRGTLKKNAVVVAGTSWGRVRAMVDEFGKPLHEAGPSTPVKIAGWRDDLPPPGEKILEVTSEARARRVVQIRQERADNANEEKIWSSIDAQREADRATYLENRQKLIDRGIRYGSTLRRVVHREKRLRRDTGERDKPALRMILRTDVDGSLEAIQTVIDTYNNEEVDLQIVDADVGPPNPELVEIAEEFDAKIVCFNVPIPVKVQEMAVQKNVQIDHCNVIYRFVDSLKADLDKALGPVTELKLVGEGHVLKQFLIPASGSKKQPIAGTLVDWGVFPKNAVFRIIRGQNPIYEGHVESLKQENEFVNEAKTNTEVGIALKNKDIKFKADDTVEVYEEVLTPRHVAWNPPGF